MSNLRKNVMLQLSKHNKVLDTSKSRNDNPVRNAYETFKILEREPSPELDNISQLAHDTSYNDPRISPFSCASEILRCCTPVTGIDDIFECRGSSPLTYQDISTNILCPTLYENNIKTTPIDLQMQEPDSGSTIMTKKYTDTIHVLQLTNNNQSADNSIDKISQSNNNYLDPAIALNNEDNISNFKNNSEVNNLILENPVPIQSSTPKQHSISESNKPNIDVNKDEFEKSAEELMEQLSRESKNGSTCEKPKTRKEDLDKQNQRNFISRNVEKNPKSVSTNSDSRRHNTQVWKLNDTPVCKTFFLGTLGFKNDQTVKTILKANFKLGIKNPDLQEAAPEQRGKNVPWNKLPEDYKQNIKSFIEKLQPTVSHYNVKHAPKRKYLPCWVTFSDIYKDYITYCSDKGIRLCSWPYFHNIVQEMNLSTSNPRQDLCTICANHETEHP
ncbi:hypothetical protein ACJJTC_018659 [Scirpophaga incertulas]